MSGGSYDYLYMSAPESLGSIARAIDDMAERCTARSSGPSDDSCWDGEKDAPLDLEALRRCGEELARVATHVEESAKLVLGLERTLRAVEWWQSGDQTAGGVVRAFLEDTQKETKT
jgi:hypothetical protein